MSPKLTLWGTEFSPPVRAVLLTLEALELEYEFKEISPLKGEHKTPEYLKLNPQHTVPTLVDEGKSIWDSHAIAAYLVRKYGKDDSFYPKNFYQRAVVDQRLHYENGVVFSTALRNVLGPIFRGTATPEQTAENIKAVYETYDMLETFLADQPYFAGASLTIADFSIVSSVSSLAGLAPIDAAKHPKLAAWFERIQQLPYYEKGCGSGLKKAQAFFKEKMAKKN